MPEMPLRRAGQTGLYLPAIGLGLDRWGIPRPGAQHPVSEDEGFRILDRALELGVTHWDTASGYGEGESEATLGRFFASRGAATRDRVIVSTKWAGPCGAGRGHLRKAVDGCLRRLQTDYLDVFMLHNPGTDAEGHYLAPLEETWGALDDLMTQGKILYLGISNAHSANVRDAYAALSAVTRNPSHRLALVENNYSLLQRGQVGRGMYYVWPHGSSETAFFHDLEQLGVGLIPFWPLSAGALSGRYRKANIEMQRQVVQDATFRAQYLEGPTLNAIEELALFAERKGATLAQLAIAWLLTKSQVASVITGVTRLAQLEDNAAAVALSLTTAEITAIETIAAGAESVDAFCARYFK